MATVFGLNINNFLTVFQSIVCYILSFSQNWFNNVFSNNFFDNLRIDKLAVAWIDIIFCNRSYCFTIVGIDRFIFDITNSDFTSNRIFNGSFVHNFWLGFMPRSFISFISNFFATVYCFSLRLTIIIFQTVISDILNISLDCFGLCFSHNLTNDFRIAQIACLWINIIKSGSYDMFIAFICCCDFFITYFSQAINWIINLFQRFICLLRIISPKCKSIFRISNFILLLKRNCRIWFICH